MKLREFWHWLQRLSRILSRARISMAAASVAFFGFLAIFPAAAVIIALWGVGADPGFVLEQMAPLQDLLPPDAYRLIADQVVALIEASTPGLGLATLISTLLALWSARAGISALLSGLNAIHGLPDHGGIWHEVLSLLLTAALVGITLMALLVGVVMPVALDYLPTGPVGAFALHAANLVLALALAVLGLALAYRFGPNWYGAARVAFFTPGLIVALSLWIAVSRGLVFYLANFYSYNKIYGSIGAVAALLMWFYLSSYAVLLGAAVDAERVTRKNRQPAPADRLPDQDSPEKISV